LDDVRPNREELGELGGQRVGRFLGDEVSAESCRRANVGRPPSQDLGGVGQLLLLGAGDDQRRALDAPANTEVILVVLAVEPEAGPIVGADPGSAQIPAAAGANAAK
jgi:hypothetical protein